MRKRNLLGVKAKLGGAYSVTVSYTVVNADYLPKERTVRIHVSSFT